jgi:transposase InsO family protein
LTVQPPTVSSIPALHAFDSRTSTWQSYRDRVSFYFKANRIDTDDDKKALFLWAVGDTTYNLLESLVSPRSLTNDETKFMELIKLLDVHYDTTKNIMTSTYDFYTCYQKPGQTFSEWKAELCEKLRHCGFTTSGLKDKPQDRALRDMYVIGIKSQKIRQALLKEQDPDVEKTEKIIQLAERLQDDIRHFGTPVDDTDYTVAKVHNHQQKQQKQHQQHKQHQQQNKLFEKNELKPCDTCGSTKHFRSTCKYRNFICNFCKKTGHLQRVCRKKTEEKIITTKHITTIYKLNCSNEKKQSRYSSTIPLQVNDRQITFELDTGTFNTIINMDDWYKIGSPPIHSSKLKLKCYSGNTLKVKGKCNVKVQYKKQSYNLSMIIVYGKNPPLLGLQWIKIMQLDLNRIIHEQNSIHKIYVHSNLQTTLQKFKNVLNNQLGHCTKVQAHIQLKPDATPKFFKPRPLPFAYVDGVKEEIQRNVAAGVLERIDTSLWAAPIVPVKKPNGKIRICGDFKVTINPQILVDQHPIPSIEELLARLNNGQKFTKLDLSDAYLQVELDEHSKNLVIINTPLGLFRYNRMPFGIANAPAIFQRIIDQVIAGIPNCIAYLDDILLTGKNEEEHLRTLEMVLQRLSEFGFKCNPEKCLFFQDEVSYLGFIIDKNGKHPDPRRVDAIINMPAPKNVKELEAFIGKINYYGKFISNFSDKCKLLNHLRKKNIPWKWNPECQKAFNNLLQEISNTTTLVHFDAQLPLILATDASHYGIGAVIMHRYADGSERPIAYASKTLTAAERNYSQIEKEALSIIYGVKKFHQYLAGRSFELNTDHQPLLTIFNPTKGIPITTANRLQRWAIYLMGYNYNIRYKPTRFHANADALSRLPSGYDKSFIDNDAAQINFIQTQLAEQWPLKATEIASATTNDNTLHLVRQFTLTKWPSSFSRKKTPELIPYFNNRHSLSVVNGCVLKDTQVIIPTQLHSRVIRMLHRAHLGTIKMKQLARTSCWWPKMDKDILDITKSCKICAQLQPLPQSQFKSWEEPKQVWSRLHMDFAGPIWNSKWLIIVDAKSKFPIVADMGNDTTAKNLCYALDQVIDWFGPPETLVSDNGPPFNSYEMNQFYDKYGINHITTPPYHPASNGLAERFVRSFKEAMIKQQQMGQTNKFTALRNILRTYRWSPHTSTGSSPANMILQHSIRTEFDMMKPREPIKPPQQIKYAIGQLVWTLKYQLNKRPQWEPAIITKNVSTMIYEIKLSNGQHYKRHQNQLRLRYSSNNKSSEIDSLPDDLLNIESQSKTVESSHSSSPRYPRRTHKAPDRYTP